MMQLHALFFVVVASLLCLQGVLSLPQPDGGNEKQPLTMPKKGGKGYAPKVNSFMKQEDVNISFPPTDPSGSCQICDEEDGCTAKGHPLYQWGWTVENMYAWRADSEEWGWWAAQMNRTFPHQQSFSIINKLKPKTHANLFEIVTIDFSQIPAKQNVSVWTKVEPGTSCLTTFQGSMKFWQSHMSVVNVYQSIHYVK